MRDLVIITCYNNPDLVNQMKESVLKCKSDLDIQFFAIDNCNNARFSSAAAAYNYAVENADSAKVLCFCHQDIVFYGDSIQRIFELCNAANILYGAAGVQNVGRGKGDRIVSCMSMIKRGWKYNTLEKGTTKDVFTLDECLICGNRLLFEQVRFDEIACDGWHLYAADLCMQCHVKGIGVRVFDADIVHLSGGNPDKSFYSCERKLVKKYRSDFPLISYTCGWAYTDPFRYGLLTLYRKLRHGI